MTRYIYGWSCRMADAPANDGRYVNSARRGRGREKRRSEHREKRRSAVTENRRSAVTENRRSTERVRRRSAILRKSEILYNKHRSVRIVIETKRHGTYSMYLVPQRLELDSTHFHNTTFRHFPPYTCHFLVLDSSRLLTNAMLRTIMALKWTILPG